MPATYTTRNRAIKQETGSNLNVWGQALNNQVIDLFDESLDGISTINLGGAATFDLSSATYTKNGESDTSRRRILIFTSPNAAGTDVTIPGVEKWYFVRNSGSYAVTLAPSGGTPASVPAGADAIIYSDGTDCFVFRQRLNEMAAPDDNVDLNSQKLINVADGTADTDGVNKLQVTSLTQPLVDLADDWAQKTDDYVSGTDNSAKSWAIGGTGNGDPAAGSAKEWATSTSVVSGGQKGALGYANDASASASSASGFATAASGYADDASGFADAASASATAASGSASDAATSYGDFLDIWVVSATEPGTTQPGMVWFDTAGDVIKVRNAADTDWLTVSGSDAASESTAGIIRIATQAEANGGVFDTLAISPKKLNDYEGYLRYGSAYLIASTDLDTVTRPGFYSGYSMTNAPGGSSAVFYVEVQQHSFLTDWILQIAVDGSGTTLRKYVRRRVSGSWGAWKEVAFNGSFVAGSPVSASGANVTFTSIDCDDIVFKFDGVSHNNGSNTSLRIYYSTDNGSSWSAGFMQPTASIAAGSTATGSIAIFGLREGTGLIVGGQLSTSGTYPGFIQQSTNPTTSISAGAQINAIKFEWAAGSFDAGTITASKRG